MAGAPRGDPPGGLRRPAGCAGLRLRHRARPGPGPGSRPRGLDLGQRRRAAAFPGAEPARPGPPGPGVVHQPRRALGPGRQPARPVPGRGLRAGPVPAGPDGSGTPARRGPAGPARGPVRGELGQVRAAPGPGPHGGAGVGADAPVQPRRAGPGRFHQGRERRPGPAPARPAVARPVLAGRGVPGGLDAGRQPGHPGRPDPAAGLHHHPARLRAAGTRARREADHGLVPGPAAERAAPVRSRPLPPGRPGPAPGRNVKFFRNEDRPPYSLTQPDRRGGHRRRPCAG